MTGYEHVILDVVLTAFAVIFAGMAIAALLMLGAAVYVAIK